jgi:hypothetical protein
VQNFFQFFRFHAINHPKLCKTLSVKHRNLMMVGGIWFYALLVLFMPLIGNFGHFGYSERLNKCDYIEDEDVDENSRKMFYFIAFGLPSLLVVASYFRIWTSTTDLSSIVKPYLLV